MPRIVGLAAALVCVVAAAIVVLAAALAVTVGIAVRFTGKDSEPQAPEGPRPHGEDELTRLVILRAFVAGRRTRGVRQQKMRATAVIRLEDTAIGDPAASKDVLARALFYALVLAESDRTVKAWQKTVRRLSTRIAAHGEDPHLIYVRMVEATAGEADATIAARALGLDPADVERHRRFVFELPIGQWR
jgi:hypothetical protein